MTQQSPSDKRAKVVSLLVRYKSGSVDEFIANSSNDVSRHGVFVRSPQPFAVGTLLRFELRLSTEATVLAGVGRVVWKREPTQATPEKPAGMGLAFVRLDESSRLVLERLLKQKPDAGKSFSAEPASRDAVLPGSDRVPSLSPAGIADRVEEAAPTTEPNPATSKKAPAVPKSKPGPAAAAAPRSGQAETPRAVLARPAAGRPPEPKPAAPATSPDFEEPIASSSNPVYPRKESRIEGLPLADPEDAEDPENDDRKEGTVVMATADLHRRVASPNIDEIVGSSFHAAQLTGPQDVSSGERLALAAVSTPGPMAAAPVIGPASSGRLMAAPSGPHMMGPPSGPHMMGPPSGHLAAHAQMMAAGSQSYVPTPSAPQVAAAPAHVPGWGGAPPAVDPDLLVSGRRRSGGLLTALLGVIALLLVVIVIMLVGGGFFLFKSSMSTTAPPPPASAPPPATPATASLPSPIPAPSPTVPPTPASASASSAPAAPPASATTTPAAVPPASAAPPAPKAAPPRYVAPPRRPPAPAQPQLPAWARDPSPNDPDIVPPKK